jgi:FkbM family methyltransferase
MKLIKNFFSSLKLLGIVMRIKERLILLNEPKSTIHKRIIFYRQLIKPGDVVFDVGANLGNRTEVFLKIGAKVLCVEPNNRLVQKLINKFGFKIIVEQAGVGSKPEILNLNIGTSSTISSFSEDFISKAGKDRFSEFSWNDKILCRIITLDKLIDNYGKPNFIKIDVEGYEIEALKGLSTPIDCISIEYNVPDFIDQLSQCIKQFYSLNQNCKFNYSIADSMIFELSENIDYESFLILINSKKFIESSWGDVYAFNN